jgi:hypothetical protein
MKTKLSFLSILLILSIGAIGVQTTFAQGLSPKCIDEFVSLPNKRSDFVLGNFLSEELPAAVLKIKAQEKASKIPVIGFFLGPGADSEVTELQEYVQLRRPHPQNKQQ